MSISNIQIVSISVQSRIWIVDGYNDFHESDDCRELLVLSLSSPDIDNGIKPLLDSRVNNRVYCERAIVTISHDFDSNLA
jgi:hypothetical protein